MKKFSLLLLLITSLSLSGCGNKKTPSQPDPVDPTPVDPGTDPIDPGTDPVDPVDPEPSEYGYNHYNGYYGELKWTDSEDLITKLHDIISKDVNYIRYDASSTADTNWETNIDADHAYDDLEMLDVVYSKDDVPASKTNSGWQREHAFVASLMTGVTTSVAVGAKQGRAVDFHNLFAASTTGNTSRSDKNFGTVVKDDPNYTGYQKVEGNYTSNNKLFEPSDEDKGKLSRAILYMIVMYNSDEEEDISLKLNYNAADQETYGQQSKTVHIPMVYKPLSLNEGLAENNLVNFTNYHYADAPSVQALVAKYGEEEDGYAAYVRDNAAYSIGFASDILSWATKPVDLQEYQHNQSVYSHVHSAYEIAQNNRNPFVDYPQLVDYAFGNKKDEAGDINLLKPTVVDLKLEGDGIHHYAIKTAKREFEVGETFDSNSYELVGIKNDFSQVAVSGDIDKTQPYTFTASDIGTKTMKIVTNDNEIELKVNVIAKQNEYSYTYVYSSSSEFGAKELAANTPRSVTLNGESWTVTSKKDTQFTNSNVLASVNIGNGTSKCAEEFTLVSGRDFTSVNQMKLIMNGASGKNYSVKITIGDDDAYSYTMNCTGTSGTNVTKEFNISPALSGKVTIKISGITGSLFINTIAINEVK